MKPIGFPVRMAVHDDIVCFCLGRFGFGCIVCYLMPNPFLIHNKTVSISKQLNFSISTQF